MIVRDTNIDDYERELNIKLELASLEKYVERFPRVLKGDPELFMTLKNWVGQNDAFF